MYSQLFVVKTIKFGNELKNPCQTWKIERIMHYNLESLLQNAQFLGGAHCIRVKCYQKCNTSQTRRRITDSTDHNAGFHCVAII